MWSLLELLLDFFWSVVLLGGEYLSDSSSVGGVEFSCADFLRSLLETSQDFLCSVCVERFGGKYLSDSRTGGVAVDDFLRSLLDPLFGFFCSASAKLFGGTYLTDSSVGGVEFSCDDFL